MSLDVSILKYLKTKTLMLGVFVLSSQAYALNLSIEKKGSNPIQRIEFAVDKTNVSGSTTSNFMEGKTSVGNFGNFNRNVPDGMIKALNSLLKDAKQEQMKGDYKVVLDGNEISLSKQKWEELERWIRLFLRKQVKWTKDQKVTFDKPSLMATWKNKSYKCKILENHYFLCPLEGKNSVLFDLRPRLK